MGWSDDQSSTWECGYWCLYQGYNLFGTEDGGYCLCGENLHPDSSQVSDAQCDAPCTGDASETCGAFLRMSFYSWNWDGYYGFYTSSGSAFRGAVSAAPDRNISAVKSDMTSVFTPSTEKKPAASIRARS